MRAMQVTIYVLNGEKNEFLKPENIRISGLSGYQVCYTPVRNEPMLYYVSAGNHSTGSFILFGKLSCDNQQFIRACH